MDFGIDVLLSDSGLMSQLKKQPYAVVAHPASVNRKLKHSVDLLHAEAKMACAFGPQHGIKGDKQYNMIETPDELDKKLGIPVFSLYGEHRRPTKDMIQKADLFLYDLQDVGCRIYTYLTTLVYFLDELSGTGKRLWVLDRPNPIGRPSEGALLQKELMSFVGAVEGVPIRHGWTMGEFAKFYVQEKKLDLDLKVIQLNSWNPREAAWPEGERSWVNPSPNIATLNAARVFPGSVLFEGLEFSEGRGSTRPLELVGAPDFPATEIVSEIEQKYPQYIQGCYLRACFFEPTFDKYCGELCEGIHIHCDNTNFEASSFRPYRLLLLIIKMLSKKLGPIQWRKDRYEYEDSKLAFDLINGDAAIRKWVENPNSTMDDLEQQLSPGEKNWIEKAESFYIYR